jgi:hypothetical protein
MALTFIDTVNLPRQATGQGEFTEVLNEDLCGARNVRASLRWLGATQTFSPAADDKHQLIYLMEGKGCIRLNDRDYDLEKGAGVYLGPRETVTIRPANGASLKLFHLVVPQIPK